MEKKEKTRKEKKRKQEKKRKGKERKKKRKRKKRNLKKRKKGVLHRILNLPRLTRPVLVATQRGTSVGGHLQS